MPSPAAREKPSARRKADGRTARSSRTLLDELATIRRNRVHPKLDRALWVEMLTHLIDP